MPAPQRYAILGVTGQLGFDLARTFDLPGELIRLTRADLDLTEPGAIARVLGDRKSTRLNSSHIQKSRMPSSA